jgi:predicted PurR-regulated permease PerM
MKIEKNKIPINVNINFSTIIKTTIFFIFLFLIVELKDLVLLFLTAIILASAMEPFVKVMEKIKFPRILSVSIVYIIFISLIFWLSVLFVPALIEQINNFIKQLPVYVESLNTWLDTKVESGGVLASIVEELRNRAQDSLANVSELSVKSSAIKTNVNIFGGTILGIFGGLLNFALVLVFSFYLAIQDHGIDNFLKIITPVKYTKYSLNLWKRTQRKISLWMQGQLFLAFIIGLITYLGLIIFFDFEHSLLLAVIAGLMELIPIAGPFLAAIPAMIIALITGGWSLVGGVAIFYLVIQMIENQIIYPLVVNKVVGVPSIIVILSVIIGVQLFGFLGAILAIPISAAFMEYYKDVEKRQLEAIRRGEEKEVDLSKKESEK